MNKKTTKYVISAELSKFNDTQNSVRSFNLGQRINATKTVPFIEQQGVYKGHKEKSFMLITENVMLVKSLATLFEQEAVLMISGENRGYLLTGKHFENETPLGKMVESLDEPKGLDAYSYIPESQVYYWFDGRIL